jgi:death-on-curing protein
MILHDTLLAQFGGPVGIRDQGLLKSALARPQQFLAYGKAPGIIEMAAAYTVGIVRNHPFVDGNKRTGLTVGILFLECNGYQFIATEQDAAQAVLALAEGELDEAGYVAFLRTNSKLVRRTKGMH